MRSGAALNDLDLYDVPPTMLALLDLSIAKNLQGRGAEMRGDVGARDSAGGASSVARLKLRFAEQTRMLFA